MKNIILFLFVLISIALKAQTSNLNQQKYWDYRDRLKKWFIKVGANTGESQLMTCRGTKMNGTNSDYTTNNNYFPRNTSWMQWGDNPILD